MTAILAADHPALATPESERTLAFHFLADDGRVAHTNARIVPVAGQTLGIGAGKIIACERGLHGSVRALDALSYAPGSMVQRVEIWGDVARESDKLAGRYRRCLWVADATRTLHEFAVWAAESALIRERERGREPDARCWNALAVKARWIRGEATDEELAAARAAARDAAWAAAWAAAWDAARAAARAAAWDAAWAAARDAAWAAAWDAARDALNTELERRLLLLAPVAAAQ